MTTDDAIIRRSFDEPSVFGDLFERHGSVIYRYVARRVGHTTAEDVMSETFLTAFRSRNRFDCRTPQWQPPPTPSMSLKLPAFARSRSTQ